MYKVEDKVQPFWASYASAAGGRDPLAIQNSSVVIYSSMMVGITNVTIRVRYMGFFCWLFDTILNSVEKKNSLSEQVLYIRRAELLLAYIMVHNYPDVTGISGTSFASKNLATHIDLGLGADWVHKQAKKDVYWQNKLGIFGQYYSGVMRTLGLINHPSEAQQINIYTLTEDGYKLAQFYSDQIPEEDEELFWSSVTSGSLKESSLSNLKSFALHVISTNSQEHIFYTNLLLAEDSSSTDPTYNRRDTLKLMLQFLNRNSQDVTEPVTQFLKENYRIKISETQLEFDVGTAWHLYELNELVHVAYEHFHGCFLYFIDEHPTPLEYAIQSITDVTLGALESGNNVLPTFTLNDLRSSLLEASDEIYEYNERMKSAFKNREYGECLANAIMILLKAHNNSEHHYDQLQEFAARDSNNFNRKGYALELLEQLVRQMNHLPIDSYIPAVLMEAINVHTFSSYTKSRIGQNLVHNYMIEENQVWRLRETLPNRTTPRLQNAMQYMVDLGWVNVKNKMYQITESGKQHI